MFADDRDSLRRMYAEAWHRHSRALPMEPIHAQIADVVAIHPEYQGLIEAPDHVVRQEWSPDEGQTNPFLHMGMHLAIRDQVATDRPAGITRVHARLLRRSGDRHAVEHLMMECLGTVLWEAQRRSGGPDEAAYLECLRRL